MEETDKQPIGKDSATYWLYDVNYVSKQWHYCLATHRILLPWDIKGGFEKYKTQDAIAKKLGKTFNQQDKSYYEESLAIWNFIHCMKKGDVVFVKDGENKIVGYGIVTGDYEYVTRAENHKSQRSVEWESIEWTLNLPKRNSVLLNLTEHFGLVKNINNLIDAQSLEVEVTNMMIERYTKEDFLDEVFMTGQQATRLEKLLRRKKNIILQGAPGVGKTFSAKRLAYMMMGRKDNSRVEIVQFHQNYSYEDFIMGYKPVKEGSFSLTTGVFYDFCKRAEKDSSRDYFFIIDEINRGNLSKIFGELLQLIEADYRNSSIKLAYNKDESFQVPSNLYIIGMMNTADRSLAMIDYALRRRFSFFDMEPGFDTEGFHNYQKSVGSRSLNKLVEGIKQVNKLILSDDSLGKGFQIGHSYLIQNLKNKDDRQVIFDRDLAESIVEFDLMPLVEEYWFDNEAKMNQAKDILQKALRNDN